MVYLYSLYACICVVLFRMYLCLHLFCRFAYYACILWCCIYFATISGCVQMLRLMMQHLGVLNTNLRIYSQYFYIVHVH